MYVENYIEQYLKYKTKQRVVMTIIIPTRDLVQDLNKDLSDTCHLYPNINAIFDRLLTALTLKDIAQWKLDKEKSRFIDIVSSIEPVKAQDVGDSIYDIGKRLFEILTYHNAYESGFLIYQKDKWVGSDLILRKLTRDELPEIH